MEDRPYIVSWNLTRRCNLLCPHCYIDANKGGPEELTREEALFVIDELSYLNSKLMLVLSGGEPMLREDILDIVEYSTQAGFITVMGSNGTLLTEGNISALKEAGLKGLGVSIDGARPEGHDSFRGLAGAWELSVGALRKARGLGLETQMDVTLTDRNWEDMEGFIELGAALGAKAVNFFFLVCTGRAMGTDISTGHYEEALRRIAKSTMTERRLMVRARCAPHIYRVLHEEGFSIPEGTRGCLAGRAYIRIDPEGNVTPCPYMPVVAGNVRKTSLAAIWEESPEFRLMREGTYRGRCGECEYTGICGGCRARALSDTGDIMGEDPLCSYAPEGRGCVKLDDDFQSELRWEGNAKERIKKVPVFMKGMVIRVIETRARQEGIDVISSEFIDSIKTRGYPGMHGKKGS
jgi:radical SAM protein with 4Fe4S-binding SPASM domain